MKNYLGNGRNEIICDECKTSIGIDEDGEYKIAIKYKDLNWGHECSSCRQSRQNNYDDYVDPKRAYR